MMKQSALAVLAAHLVGLAAAGTKVWDGSFDDLTVASLADWSWSNQAGPYQWYIHGDSDTSAYLDFSADAAGPGATKGAKVTLDDTAYWNGQNMRRTELIPSVTDTSSITSGTLYYHFSLKREDTNAPSTEREHQIAFFESHFTELKYGGSSADKLQWFAASSSQWETAFEAGVWHNFAYEIDFDASTVGLWHSTGSEALTQAVAPVKASVSSNGADWHVGVLELQGSSADTTEDLFYSGVYIESGDLTTAFSSAGSSSSGSASGAASSAAAPSSSAAAAASSAPASSAAPVAAASSSSASSSAVVAAPTSSAVPTAAAPATTALASSSTKSCVKRTKTVYVTQSA